jgi:hypothetical protein
MKIILSLCLALALLLGAHAHAAETLPVRVGYLRDFCKELRDIPGWQAPAGVVTQQIAGMVEGDIVETDTTFWIEASKAIEKHRAERKKSTAMR